MYCLSNHFEPLGSVRSRALGQLEESKSRWPTQQIIIHIKPTQTTADLEMLCSSLDAAVMFKLRNHEIRSRPADPLYLTDLTCQALDNPGQFKKDQVEVQSNTISWIYRVRQ
jgi:hypothetical protein